MFGRPNAKTGATRSKVRDKRLNVPNVFVDLRDKVYRTQTWAPGKLILSGYEGEIATGEDFSGVLKIGGNPKVYLFDGHAARVDYINKKMAASFELHSAEARELLAQCYAVKEANPAADLPPLLFSLAYRTVNWSLSGFLIGGYGGKLKSGQQFSGMIRLDKTTKTGFFRAEVKRHVGSVRGLGAQFLSLTPETFEMFEIAMKKSELAKS
jgi:hypothetical protein